MKKRWIGIFLLLLTISAFFFFDLHHLMDLQFIKSQHSFLQELYANHPIQVIVAFSTLYIVTTALSLPTVIFLSVLGGAVFGLITGAIIVCIASTLGATLSFLMSRWIFHDMVQARFSHYLKRFNAGMKKHGAFYLFTLRTTPVVPFFIVNIVMGLTNIRTQLFFWVSLVGMIPSKLIYVNAGTQLATIEHFSDILSARVLLSLLSLALIPLALKLILNVVRPTPIP